MVLEQLVDKTMTELLGIEVGFEEFEVKKV